MSTIKRLGIVAVVCMVPLWSFAKSTVYTVKKGDALYTIAKKHHISVKTLCQLNGISTKTVLKPGQKLKVAASSKKATKTHRVAKKKNTLKKRLIASRTRKYHTAKRSLQDIVFGSLSYNESSLSPKSQRIIQLAKKKLGRRYVWGAAGQHDTFDCSGLTSYVCKMNGIKIPRRAIQQSKVGKFVPRDQLQPGDLVFFDTSKQRRGYVNHVGIYIGNGKFIHASSAKKKVVITSLDKPFYKSRYKGARRVVASL